MIKLYAKNPTPTPAPVPATSTYGHLSVEVGVALVVLEAHLNLLPPHQQEFGGSLIKQAKAKVKPLSDKQLFWIKELAKKGADLFTGKTSAPAPAAMSIGALTGVFNLFNTAAAHLKAPKIKLQAGKLPVCLSVAGPNQKEPGTIKVTDGMQGGLWYGRISTDGTWTPGKALNANKDALVSVYSLLVSFADDPAGVAASQGKLTAKCVFCRKGLKTDESLAVGYGPDCAAHYGLPWGGK